MTSKDQYYRKAKNIEEGNFTEPYKKWWRIFCRAKESFDAYKYIKTAGDKELSRWASDAKRRKLDELQISALQSIEFYKNAQNKCKYGSASAHQTKTPTEDVVRLQKKFESVGWPGMSNTEYQALIDGRIRLQKLHDRTGVSPRVVKALGLRDYILE